jgi:hypothetical protein
MNCLRILILGGADLIASTWCATWFDAPPD